MTFILSNINWYEQNGRHYRSTSENRTCIARTCEISVTPGASIGVLHENEVVYTTGFEYRDVAKQLPTDENALYHIVS